MAYIIINDQELLSLTILYFMAINFGKHLVHFEESYVKAYRSYSMKILDYGCSLKCHKQIKRLWKLLKIFHVYILLN